MVNFWGIESLESEELKCLLIAYDKILTESKVFCLFVVIVFFKLLENRKGLQWNKWRWSSYKRRYWTNERRI